MLIVFGGFLIVVVLVGLASLFLNKQVANYRSKNKAKAELEEDKRKVKPLKVGLPRNLNRPYRKVSPRKNQRQEAPMALINQQLIRQPMQMPFL